MPEKQRYLGKNWEDTGTRSSRTWEKRPKRANWPMRISGVLSSVLLAGAAAMMVEGEKDIRYDTSEDKITITPNKNAWEKDLAPYSLPVAGIGLITGAYSLAHFYARRKSDKFLKEIRTQNHGSRT